MWTEGSTLYCTLYEYSLAGLFGRDMQAALLCIFFLAAASMHMKGEWPAPLLERLDKLSSWGSWEFLSSIESAWTFPYTRKGEVR